MKKLLPLLLCVPLIGWAHGVPESTVKAMADASLIDFIYFGLINESLQNEIERALATLPPREAEVVQCFFGLGGKPPMTLEEIGSRYDLTRERVRQIKDKAIRRLKSTSKSKLLKSYLG